MSKIAEEADEDVTAEEIFAEAIDAMNDLGRYKGHSPYEMMLGRTPEPTVGDMFGGEENLPMMHKTYSAEDDEYAKTRRRDSRPARHFSRRFHYDDLRCWSCAGPERRRNGPQDSCAIGGLRRRRVQSNNLEVFGLGQLPS